MVTVVHNCFLSVHIVCQVNHVRPSLAPLNPLLSWTEAHTGVADTITSSGLGSSISTSNCTLGISSSLINREAEN